MVPHILYGYEVQNSGRASNPLGAMWATVYAARAACAAAFVKPVKMLRPHGKASDVDDPLISLLIIRRGWTVSIAI